MNTLTLRGTLVGQDRPSDIVLADGKVASIRRARTRTTQAGEPDAILAPPLFDIQVNGAFGIDLQSRDLTPADVAALNERLMARGVSQWIPTLITGPLKTMERNCGVIAEAITAHKLARRIPGIHLEGPYISPEDGPRGAHPKRHVRKPNLREFDRLLKAADGRIVYTTVAPERPNGVSFIKGVVKRGVAVSLGHHEADRDTIMKAVDAGARLCTHLGNGMPPRIHRHHNALWPQLSNDGLYASLIADMHHLTADMLRVFERAKGAENIVLVSDCMPIAGLKPGTYELMGQEVELTKANRINLVGTELLAGSALSLIEGVLNMARHSDLTLEEAFDCATVNPAKALGLRPPTTHIVEGKRANFMVLRIGKRNEPVIDRVFVDGKDVTAD